MTTTLSARELLDRISADEIRERLATAEAEAKALRTLLRAAVQRDRGRKREAQQESPARG